MKISDIHPNPDNPRTASEEKIQSLARSIKDFPEMMELRPIVVDENNMVLGGNQRLEAIKTLTFPKDEIPDSWVRKASELSEEQKKEFIIKDNVTFGEWDLEQLEDWDVEELSEWGLDDVFSLPEDKEETLYTKKITAPTYRPADEKPNIAELYDLEKWTKLIAAIDKARIKPLEKEFLKFAAGRHIVFNYDKIADYYASSGKTIQKLMEASALVIIDFDAAIEGGYIELSEKLNKLFDNDFPADNENS